MKYTSHTENAMVETLTNISPKPTSYSGQGFNYLDLDDRVFEILLYQIFKARIENNDFNIADKFDKVVLMQGVGERGRDCFLMKNAKNVGVIQCKQVNKNINRPDVLKEILKFLIYYTQDKTLIQDLNNFHYYFAVSKGFTETAILLLSNFNESYDENETRAICTKILSQYSSLKNVSYDTISDTIKNAFLKITVSQIIPADLSQYLYEHDKLIKNFFRVLTVTDNTLLEGIIENYLAPILSKLYTKGNKDYKDFTYRFKEYLQRVYSYYSSSRTLVFGNQQKKLEDFYYPLNVECIIDAENEKKFRINTDVYHEDFLPQFKKVIMVDNGGMGKSTIMKWLFLSVIKERKGIPIFIELRKLTNGRTIIDEIIQELNPIDQEIEKEIVAKLIEEGNFIFFFDGYDEIVPSDRTFVTTDLQNFISKAAKNLFIMTSRPETALNTFSDFKEFKIKNLEKKEAYELIKKIGNNSDKSQRLIKRIKENNLHNVEEFLKSPLLVSLLYKKFEHRENIPINLQEFYYEVFEALFQDHDLTKGDSFIRPKKTNLSLSEFFQILREFSFFTFKKGEIEYNDAIINKYLSNISKRLPNLTFKTTDFLEDIVKNVPLFNKEGLQYRWSHKSFQEYFAAEFICRDTKEKQIEILHSMYESEKFEKYNFVLKLCFDIDFNSFRNAIVIPYLKEYIEFYDSALDEFKENKNIPASYLQFRIELLFNKSHLIIFNPKREDDFMDNAFNFFDTNNNNLFAKYPTFLPEEYHIRMIGLGEEVMVATAVKYNDLTKFLIDKNMPFLKLSKAKHDKYSVKQFFEDKIVPKYSIINMHNNDLTDLQQVSFYNNLISSFSRDSVFMSIDYKKCKKYLEEYEKFDAQADDDYYTSGF